MTVISISLPRHPSFPIEGLIVYRMREVCKRSMWFAKFRLDQSLIKNCIHLSIAFTPSKQNKRRNWKLSDDIFYVHYMTNDFRLTEQRFRLTRFSSEKEFLTLKEVVERNGLTKERWQRMQIRLIAV